MSVGRPYKAPRTGGNHTNSIVGGVKKDGFKQQDNNGFRYPTSVLEYTIHCGSKLHPTQKPVELFEYLIKTFSNEGDLVLDNCAGSGTTAVACLNCNRDYILMEKESKFCEIAKNRIEK
jgi:site-specific DNA-methyltransferase (adenine-specific)